MNVEIGVSTRVLRSVARLKGASLQPPAFGAATTQQLPPDDGDPDYEDVSGSIPISKGSKRRAIEKPGQQKRHKPNTPFHEDEDEVPKPKRKKRRIPPRRPKPLQEKPENSTTYTFTFFPPAELPGPSTQKRATRASGTHQQEDTLLAENPAPTASPPQFHITSPDGQPEAVAHVSTIPASSVSPRVERSALKAPKAVRGDQQSHRYTPLLSAATRPRLAPPGTADSSEKHGRRSRRAHSAISGISQAEGLVQDSVDHDTGVPEPHIAEPSPVVDPSILFAVRPSAIDGAEERVSQDDERTDGLTQQLVTSPVIAFDHQIIAPVHSPESVNDQTIGTSGPRIPEASGTDSIAEPEVENNEAIADVTEEEPDDEDEVELMILVFDLLVFNL